MKPDKFFDKDNSINVDVAEFNEIANNKLFGKKRRRLIGYFIGFALCMFAGFYGIFGLAYEDSMKHSANIAAGSLFLLIGIFFITLFILTFFCPLVIKKIKGRVVCVFVGVFKKLYVSIDNKKPHKTRGKDIEIKEPGFKIKIQISKNKVTFK